ncbi:heterokaryon incompatibility protein-domain-containing protein, partial [Phlebopus sp. FC_14]
MGSEESTTKKSSSLCLVCRQVGHIVHSCPYFLQGSRQDKHSGLKLPTALETARTVAAFDNPHSLDTTSIPQSLCKRCKSLDVLHAFTRSVPFTLDDKSPGHSDRAKKKVLRMHSFGPVSTLELLDTCPLCRLIFDITYLTEEDILDVTSPLRNPTEGQLLLVPAWTLNRIERELRWPGYAKGKGPFARCLYTAVKPASDDWSWGLSLVDWAMDAVALVEPRGSGTTTMGVKEVNSQSVNYDMLGGWLRRCDKLHHRTCRPAWSEALRNIKLVDVATRTIVNYPAQHRDYIALSYVWGPVVQPSYSVGDVLPDLPTTIEDAMVVTLKLEKRYLWVDSLCINQSDTEEKLLQIGYMSAIYGGAWATIIAMSGTAADSGLPRVRTSVGVIPQLSLELGGKKLVSVMPTLSRQVSLSPWVKRAWTFQEGMLSPRRLFFTNHQVYFECNSSQSCESLDDSGSPFHSLSDEQRQTFLDKLPESGLSLENVLGRGGDDQAQGDAAILKYMKLVYTYTSKKVTNDGDSVHAFSAVLTRLQETTYKQDFLYGLPLEELPRALLWTHITEVPRRRAEFPAWSWAGWEGWV